MKKIIPYLKYIVPIACLLSVAAVIFMAIKLEDIRDEREAKRSEYNTAEEEFFEDDLPENQVEENEIEEDEVEKDDKNSIASQPYIVTYDVNEVIDNETQEENVEENVSDTSTVIKEEEARKILVKIFDEYKYTITFKQETNNGKYIFEVINKETESKEIKMVDIEEQTVQTIADEDE